MPEMVKKRAAQHAIEPAKVYEFLGGLFAEDVHAQRVFSMATGVVGVMHAAAASIHAIGIGLAAATGFETRHAIKQVDRLLSNRGIKVWDLFEPWVRFVLGDRDEVVVALDWTEFDADGQSTIALHVITTHGRATPLTWMTVKKDALEGKRNEYEHRLVLRLREIVPLDTKVTVLADRGFGDQKSYIGLADFGFDHVIRFRECITVRDGVSGETPPSGSAERTRENVARPERDERETTISAFVCAKAKNMKEAWCLASSRTGLKASDIVKLYGRRFTIEENFRDTTDLRFESVFCDECFLVAYFSARGVEEDRARDAMGRALARLGSDGRREQKGCESRSEAADELAGGSGLVKADDLASLMTFYIERAEQEFASVPKKRLERLEAALVTLNG